MAFYQILYWQNIPSQIKVWDDFDELKIELDQKFMVKIDQAAKEQNLIDTDGYLEQWRWGEELEYDGDAVEVAEILKKEIENKN